MREICLGIANETMFEITKRTGNLACVCSYSRYLGVLNLAPILRSKGMGRLISRVGGALFQPFGTVLRLCRPGPAGGSVTVETVSAFSPEFTAFWNVAARDYDAIAVRDEAFLTWRFMRCPKKEYIVLAARRDGKLAGYAVLSETTRDGVKTGSIVDLLTGKDDREAMSALVSASVRVLEERGVDKLRCLIASTMQPLGSMLRRHGLCLRLPVPGGIVNQCGPMRDRVCAARNWFATLADADFELS